MEEPQDQGQKQQHIQFESKDIKLNPHPEYFINVDKKTDMKQFLTALFSGRSRIYIMVGTALVLLISSVALGILIYWKDSEKTKPTQQNTTQTGGVSEAQRHLSGTRLFIDNTFIGLQDKIKTNENGEVDYSVAFAYLDERANSAPDEDAKNYMTLMKSDIYDKYEEYIKSAEVLTALLEQQNLSNYIKLELYVRLQETYRQIDDDAADRYRDELNKILQDNGIE